MDGFTNNDIATLASLNATNAYGRWGFPYGGGMGMPVAGFDGGFASPSSNAARINAVNDNVTSQNDYTRQLAQSDIEGIRNSFDMLAAANEFATTRKEMTDGFSNIANANLQNTIMGGQTALANERRQSDLFQNLNGEIADSRAEAAKCCCETQKLILERSANTDALINQRYTDLITDQKNTLQQTLNTERILAAINSRNGADL